MNNQSEKRICQNCKKDFVIELDDFGFYEKIKVPPPTFCPECRLQRRMSRRNDRTLYKRNCSLCKKIIIAMYPKDTVFPVYCKDCWYGDGWDPASYGIEFNFTRSFFEQYKELSDAVPRLALFQRNVINSDFSNMCGESKNVYLSVSAVKHSENVFYSKCVDQSSDIVDCLNIINGSQSLYENVEAQGNYNSQYLLLCRNCMDSYYSVDCINCNNCLLSYNLRNKEYCIRNKQYTKESYLKEFQKLNLKSRNSRAPLLKEFEEIRKRAIYKFGNINKILNSTGNNLLSAKNCKNCFEAYNIEDSGYCFRAYNLKDSLDFDFGNDSELMYEYSTGAKNDFNVKFSVAAMDAVRNVDYTEYCMNCDNLFGCISMKSKENAILNKVYSKKEFENLREKIIKQMGEIPYVDKNGRIYKYGEFFPSELSLWAYNESAAQEYFPLKKEEAVRGGFSWRELDTKNFNITIPPDKIPDNIDTVKENILQEILGCAHEGKCNHQCGLAFRLTDYELKFYKKHDIPLPILCPNCRHYNRFSVMPGFKLFNRQCMCEKKNHLHGTDKCEVEFETSYSPDRPEIVYCEKCYQQEVY